MKPISGKAFCAVLERHGWLLGRIQGSHHIYTKPGNPARISVPVHGHRDLKLGLMRSLMKAAGLTEDDL